jgi:hypothetical protein
LKLTKRLLCSEFQVEALLPACLQPKQTLILPPVTALLPGTRFMFWHPSHISARQVINTTFVTSHNMRSGSPLHSASPSFVIDKSDSLINGLKRAIGTMMLRERSQVAITSSVPTYHFDLPSVVVGTFQLLDETLPVQIARTVPGQQDHRLRWLCIKDAIRHFKLDYFVNCNF